MKIFPDLKQPLKRYLTLLYGIALGLALVLALLAIGLDRQGPTEIASITDVISTENASPPPAGTEVHSLGKPSEIPPIPPTPNVVTPSTLGVTSADLHGMQVNLWHPWGGTNGTELKNLLDEYSRTNQWGITVNVSAFEGFGQLDEAVDEAITAGALPDVLIDYGYKARHWDGSNLLADLTPYIEDPLWGLTTTEQADFYQGFWAEDVVQSPSSNLAKRLGIPYYRSAYVLFYNQSWAKELGYPNPPTNPNDFQKQACEAAVTKAAESGKSNAGTGGWLITPQPGGALGWIAAFGGQIINPNGQGYQFNTPQTSQAFAYIKDLVDNGCAWFDPGADPQSEFANRGALFAVGSLYDIPAQQQAFKQAGSSDNWAVIAFPSQNQPVVDTYGPSLFISQTSTARQLAAWLVVKWLVYPHNQIEWVQALETYPTRQSTTSYLIENPSDNPQWNQALKLLPDTYSEPSIASWSAMRWALSDAMTQLLDPKFSSEQIPVLLVKLDNTAAEIYSQVK